MQRRQILIAEDHKPLLAGIREILETEGYTVFTATDGRQALQMMEDRVCPDLILSDISMPWIDGFGFCEAVRAHSEWTSIPFIVLTCESERESVLRATAIGADDYIVKPFIPQELVTVIRTWLERAQVARLSH